MSQPISVSVQMDAASFHDFAAFDLLRHRKAWHRPLAFTAILLASAGVCLSQVGQKDGAALLTVVLSVVALGVPAVYFWTFFHSLRLQIKKMGLPRPFYRLTLDDPADAGLPAQRQPRRRVEPAAILPPGRTPARPAIKRKNRPFQGGFYCLTSQSAKQKQTAPWKGGESGAVCIWELLNICGC